MMHTGTKVSFLDENSKRRVICSHRSARLARSAMDACDRERERESGWRERERDASRCVLKSEKARERWWIGR